MDNFREEIAVRRKPGLYSFLYMMSWVLLILCAVIAVFGLEGTIGMFMSGEFNLYPILLLILFGGSAFLVWRNKDSLKTEYEYSFTNGDLDVSKVLNNSSRRYLTSLSMKSVEACGKVSSSSFQRYVSMSDIKKHNWFLNRDAALYYFYFVKKGVKHLMIVELSDEMISLVRKAGYLNFGVWQE